MQSKETLGGLAGLDYETTEETITVTPAFTLTVEREPIPGPELPTSPFSRVGTRWTVSVQGTICVETKRKRPGIPFLAPDMPVMPFGAQEFADGFKRQAAEIVSDPSKAR